MSKRHEEMAVSFWDEFWSSNDADASEHPDDRDRRKLAALLARVEREALERAARVCEKLAPNKCDSDACASCYLHGAADDIRALLEDS